MKKLIISAFCMMLLSACTTTQDNTNNDRRKIDFYNILFNYQILILNQKKYDLYMIPNNLLFDNNKNITKAGTNILKEIKNYHNGLKNSKVNIIAHSSNVSKDPIEDSKVSAIKVTNYYKSITENKNISFSYKGSVIPYYKAKSYNGLKKNERVEIIVYK